MGKRRPKKIYRRQAKKNKLSMTKEQRKALKKSPGNRNFWKYFGF